MKLLSIGFGVVILILGWIIFTRNEAYEVYPNPFTPGYDFLFYTYDKYTIPPQNNNLYSGKLWSDPFLDPTIYNSVYNKTMRECMDMNECTNAPENIAGECLNKCAVNAVESTGFYKNQPPVATQFDPITFEWS